MGNVPIYLIDLFYLCKKIGNVYIFFGGLIHQTHNFNYLFGKDLLKK